MKRSTAEPKYGASETVLQIERDLNGAITLGRMQAELLKSVQNHLSKLDLPRPATGKGRPAR